MKIKIGLCGLPNSGKSTFIKLVSQVEVLIAPYPFTTLKAQEYAVPIISQELKTLHSITQTSQLASHPASRQGGQGGQGEQSRQGGLVPPYLIFVDVPGLIRGAHKGEGLGNEFLSYLRGCDVILEIVRNFKREDVPHIEGSIDPLRDIKIIEEEVKLVDEEILKRAKNKKVQPGALLLDKNWFLLVNGTDADFADYMHLPAGKAETDAENNLVSLESALSPRRSVFFKNIYTLDLLWELEILEYADQLGLTTDQYGFETDKYASTYQYGYTSNIDTYKSVQDPHKSVSDPHQSVNENPRESLPDVKAGVLNPYKSVNNFLNQFRKDLDLIQFFTFTKEITQGWFIKKDSYIIDAVGMIHSDFGLKFKIAETISLENFVKIKDWEKAKKLGLIQNKGREAKIEENEIIFVKI
jgi:ribosome-binding ATPase YchF (GTP1/OBG family)